MNLQDLNNDGKGFSVLWIALHLTTAPLHSQALRGSSKLFSAPVASKKVQTLIPLGALGSRSFRSNQRPLSSVSCLCMSVTFSPEPGLPVLLLLGSQLQLRDQVLQEASPFYKSEGCALGRCPSWQYLSGSGSQAVSHLVGKSLTSSPGVLMLRAENKSCLLPCALLGPCHRAHWTFLAPDCSCRNIDLLSWSTPSKQIADHC